MKFSTDGRSALKRVFKNSQAYRKHLILHKFTQKETEALVEGTQQLMIGQVSHSMIELTSLLPISVSSPLL